MNFNSETINKIAEMVINELNIKSDFLIPVGVSARHVHLSESDFKILFGYEAKLTKKKELMGGQFASDQLVTIVSDKLKSIENVRILGPLRKESQVEISKTDSIKIGVDVPIRLSGDIEDSKGISLVGPSGVLHLNKGLIIAKRHIHMNNIDAEKFNLKDGQNVSIEFQGNRCGVMGNVLIRVDKSYTLEMHIDTDEANGYDIKCGAKGKIIK